MRLFVGQHFIFSSRLYDVSSNEQLDKQLDLTEGALCSFTFVVKLDFDFKMPSFLWQIKSWQ